MPQENKSDLLLIISSYHSTPIPEHGSKIVFQPLEQIQSFEYGRLSVSALGISDKLGLRTQDPKEATKVGLSVCLSFCDKPSSKVIIGLMTTSMLEGQLETRCC